MASSGGHDAKFAASDGQKLSRAGQRADGGDRRDLKAAMQSLIAMYRPHAPREDTDLFPRRDFL